MQPMLRARHQCLSFSNGLCTGKIHRQSSGPRLRNTGLKAMVAGRAETIKCSLWVTQTQECGQHVAPGESMLSHTE